MKIILILIFLCACISCRELIGTALIANVSTDNNVCGTCIKNDDCEWCANSMSASYGYKCEDYTSTSACLNSNQNLEDYICSDNTNLTEKSKYLLCPQDINYCEDSDDFEITGANQSIRVDTGTVGSNRTCEYRTYIGDSSTVRKYTLTINVDYVYGDNDTQLGIYKGNSSIDSYELIEKFGNGSKANVKVDIEDEYVVYVLMTFENTPSSAGFYIYASEYHQENEDDSLSSGIIALIILSILAFLVIFGVVAFFCLYKRLCKRKRLVNEAVQKPTDLPISEEGIEIEDKVDQVVQHYQNDGEDPNPIVNLQLNDNNVDEEDEGQTPISNNATTPMNMIDNNTKNFDE